MPQFRKKPIIIQAVQFDPMNVHRLVLPDGVIGIPAPGVDNWGYEGNAFHIETLEGNMIVSPGDYVITGVRGEQYPCKPDIFEETYEAI